MYKQHLEALHTVDSMFSFIMTKDDKEIAKPYVLRWLELLKDTPVVQTPIAQVIGVSDKELDLPLNLPDAPESIGDVDLSDIL